MAKVLVSLASDKTASKYTGSIKLPGMPAFPFDTKAVSPAKAKNNGLAQFARHLNMSITNLQRHMKTTTPVITVNVKDEDH